MKKGMILYMLAGQSCPLDDFELQSKAQDLGVDDIFIATSEFEISYGWWRLLCKGMHTICCVPASWDSGSNCMRIQGTPLRLCG